MARGAQKTAENMSQQGFNSAQQFNTDLTKSNAAIQNTLLPQYQSLINSPGYSPAEKSAITMNTEGAAGAAYGGAADQLSRTAARTGNAASLTAGQDKLAQEKAGTMSTIAGQNEIAFGNRKRADQTEGLQGMAGLYGMDTNLLARSLGIPPEYLQQYNNAANKPSPWAGILQSLIGAGGQVGAAALSGGGGSGGGGGG